MCGRKFWDPSRNQDHPCSGTVLKEMGMSCLRHERLDSANDHMRLEDKQESQQKNATAWSVMKSQAQASPPHRTDA